MLLAMQGGPAPLTPGENPNNFSGFWIRPILAGQKRAIHADNKRRENLLELFKNHTGTYIRVCLINLANIFPKGSIFMTKIRHSIKMKPSLITALPHTQFPNRVLSNSRKGTNSCSPLVTRTQEDKPQRRTRKDFLLTPSRYCTSLHKRALGQEQLTCSCHGQCTAPSHCVCICVVGQYLGRRTLLLGFFRMGNKCFEKYKLVDQGQFILVKFLTVQMHNHNHK